MQIQIRSKARLSGEFQQQLHARLAFMLRRFDGQIREATAWLTDLNGPKGGIDKHCLIVVKLPQGLITIERSASTFAAAFALATDRARYVLNRDLKRRGNKLRNRQRVSGVG